MQDKAIIMLEPTEYGSTEHACLYLERSVLGIVSLLNMFNMSNDKEYKLLLLDDDGGIITETIQDNYKMFKLPKSFSLSGDMYAELYEGEKLILQGKHSSDYEKVNYRKEYDKQAVYGDFLEADKIDKDNLLTLKPKAFNYEPEENTYNSESYMSAREWAEETNQLDLLQSAEEILKKFQSGGFDYLTKKEKPQESLMSEINFDDEFKRIDEFNELAKNFEENAKEKGWEDFASCGNSVSYFESIEDDFDDLFYSGRRERMLESIFKNSLWSKHILNGNGGMCLGKIYKSSDFFYGAMPDIVAVAVPVIGANYNSSVLGRYASFVRADYASDFGFMVLLQDATTGRAIKIIKNKG